MKLNKSLKAGILLIIMLFFTAVPAACTGDFEISLHSPENFNSEESDVSAVEACESAALPAGVVFSSEEGVIFEEGAIFGGEIFKSFGWPPLTVKVDGSGNGTFRTIEEALENALAGEVILVAPGTYTENLVVDSQVRLRAESGNPEDTVIRAKDPNAPVFHVTCKNVEIRGFTVEGANGCIYPENSSGIFLDGVSICKLTDNVFRDNTCAVYLKNSEACILRNNTAERNNSYGIRLEQAEGNLLENNTVRDAAFSAILLQRACGNELKGNSIRNSRRGIDLNFSDRNLLCNNTVCINGRLGPELFFLNHKLLSWSRNFDERQAGIRENASENNTLEGNDLRQAYKRPFLSANLPDLYFKDFANIIISKIRVGPSSTLFSSLLEVCYEEYKEESSHRFNCSFIAADSAVYSRPVFYSRTANPAFYCPEPRFRSP
ncbi:MAG: NosD domain-containing protein [Methanosarcinaceae archaeon]|nr:NosD domain-containing protein [Methanosarcinaceae archaeon]